MGSSLAKPIMDKRSSHGERPDYRWGASSMQGWAKYMEDRYVATSEPLWEYFYKWGFFGVFDGHGGAKVSDACSNYLISNMIETFYQNEKIQDGKQGPYDPSHSKELETIVLRKGSITERKQIIQQTPQQRVRSISVETFRDYICQSFLTIDDILQQQVLQPSSGNKQRQASAEGEQPSEPEQVEKSGSTAVCVLISPSHIFLVNCGDSRAILAIRSEVDIIEATTDHKPVNEIEKKRIEEAGGLVINQRVNGVLAVSRSLGDFDFKATPGLPQDKQAISPYPDVMTFARTKRDELLILACDGVWDVMKNEEIVGFVRYLLQCHSDMEKVCSRVVDTCLYKGSRDNITVIVVAFKAAPQYNQEFARKDQELDRMIADEARKLLTTKGAEAEIDSVVSLMTVLSTKIPEKILPPGGGLASKRYVVENIYNQLRPPPADDDQSNGKKEEKQPTGNSSGRYYLNQPQTAVMQSRKSSSPSPVNSSQVKSANSLDVSRKLPSSTGFASAGNTSYNTAKQERDYQTSSNIISWGHNEKDQYAPDPSKPQNMSHNMKRN